MVVTRQTLPHVYLLSIHRFNRIGAIDTVSYQHEHVVDWYYLIVCFAKRCNLALLMLR